jgi:hypothetical protein
MLYNSTGLWPTVQMKEVSKMKSVQVIRGSNVNGAVNNYTWKI